MYSPSLPHFLLPSVLFYSAFSSPLHTHLIGLEDLEGFKLPF